MNIYLIGMPGCGKSSVGKKVSNKLKYQYIDLDNYIEKKEGRDIPTIFKENGEKYFRELETLALNDFINSDNYVISCGGGIINNINNKNFMNGKIIYIDVKISVLEKRISQDKKNVRPLFQTKTVQELYDERIEKYKYFANITVENYNISKCIKDIVRSVK